MVIQFLMEGYQVDHDELEQYIHSEKMRNLIAKYMGEEDPLETLPYSKNPVLIEQIRAIRSSFASLDTLNLLPGEYNRMEVGKNYWGP